MRYNSFIQEHRDVTMSGTKRYEDKSGEYYLQNLDKYQKNSLNFNQRSITSLNLNSNNKNYIKYTNTNYNSNKHIIKVKKKKLYNELIPIPIKHKNKLKNDFEKKNLYNAMGNAKYIRRYQYSNNIIQQYKENQKMEQIFFNKIKFIQIWWKTIFQIIKLQKSIRGYLYRIKLISILDKSEKYIDKVLNLIKSIKKIFLCKFITYLAVYESSKKYYFYKWNDINNKKKIIKKLLDNYSSYKIFQEYNYNLNIYSTRNIDKINSENDDLDLDKEYLTIKNNKKKEKNNKSLIDTYKTSSRIKKKRRGKNLSSSSFIFDTNKKKLNIGIELSSSQIINRPKKTKINEIQKTNYNKKTSQNLNSNRVNIFEHLKSGHKRNKSNNQKYNKNKNDNYTTTSKYSLKEKYPKEKSFSDLKSVKTNYKNKSPNSNKNILFKNNNIKQDLTKSLNINSINKNLKLNSNKTKNDLNKKKRKVIVSNIANHTSNALRNNPKHKKIKVYENKLNEYNKKINLENKNEKGKDLISIDKDNKNDLLERLQPYTESIFDESQFSAILDNSTLNNNKNTINYTSSDNEKLFSNKNIINYTNSDSEKVNIYKKMRSNSCVDTPFLICDESDNNNENTIILRHHFNIWSKKTLLRLLLKKLGIIKNIILAGSIIANFTIVKLYKIFINKFRLFYVCLIFQKVNKFFDKYKIKIVIKKIKILGEKYNLYKYFNIYREITNKKNIIQNIIMYQKNKKKKHKDIRKRNKQMNFPDSGLPNEFFITDVPVNYHNTNYINNKINLSNNTNSYYIINNLNYNDNNTNKISIEYEIDKNNNSIQHQNHKLNTLGKIRSKIIELPKNIYKQKKLKQSLGLYKYNNNNAILNEDLNDKNLINNCNLFDYNANSINNNKNILINKQNLSKSVILPNNINYLKPDLTTQKNQLMMIINIVERHRKAQIYKIILSYFEIWKNSLDYNLPQINDNNFKKNIRNKNVIKNHNSFEKSKTNDKINCTNGTTDFEDLTKNTVGSDDFRTESDSKSENRISTKSLRIKLNSKLNPECNKGVYKKKTIGPNKNINFVKKTSFSNNNNININNNINNNNLLNINQNLFQLNYFRFSSNTIPHNYNLPDPIYEEDQNNYIKPISDKNINLILKNNEMNNSNYTSPEEYFGFKKANKIQEMEISFVPNNNKIISSNNKDINNNNNNNSNNNKYISSFNSNIKDIEYNEIEEKEVIVEAIEEYNDYDGDTENVFQKIKNEFDDDEEDNTIYNTFNLTKYHFKKKYSFDDIDEKIIDKKNKSMLNYSEIF